MEVYSKYEGSNLIFNLVGELDEHSAEIVRTRIDCTVAQNNFNDVILDLSRLAFMDSTGIGVIIGRYKLIKQKGKRLFVKNPSITVDKIFKMSGLYQIISKI